MLAFAPTALCARHGDDGLSGGSCFKRLRSCGRGWGFDGFSGLFFGVGRGFGLGAGFLFGLGRVDVDLRVDEVEERAELCAGVDVGHSEDGDAVAQLHDRQTLHDALNACVAAR